MLELSRIVNKMADIRSSYRGKLKSSSNYSRKYHPYTRTIRKEVNRVYDRIYATIYGHCIGDALGLLTESLTKEEAKKKYKEVCQKLEYVHKKMLPDTHRRKWEIADWTDESDQMILILQTILKNRGEANPIDFAKRLMDWSERGFPELDDVSGLGICSYTKLVVSHPQFSEMPQKAAEIVWRDSGKKSATNSAVSRTTMLGIHNYNNLGKVIKNTVDICNTTHPDPRCRASCVAVTTAIALLLQRNQRHIKKSGSYDTDGVIGEAYTYAASFLGSHDEAKELKHYMFATSLKELKLNEVGKMNYTYKTLGAGMWALKQKDFRTAIQEIVMEGGDADANSAIAGALLGCKVGIDAMPRGWIEKLVHRMWLDDMLDRYYDIVEGRHLSKETTI